MQSELISDNKYCEDNKRGQYDRVTEDKGTALGEDGQGRPPQGCDI